MTLRACSKSIDLPPPDIDLDLKDYARIACALLDVPVYSSMTESLHVLFTLYSEFRNNQHFVNVGEGASPTHAEAKIVD